MACRASGFRSINIDLIYGLPHQSLEGFGRTLDTIIAACPDRLAVYGYAHMPRLFKAQRHIDARALPAPAARIALLELAIDRLGAAAIATSGWIISLGRKTTSHALRKPVDCIATSWATRPMSVATSSA
jgi:oxygen-independent coproporphyrinogen-3 oxidase